jgi:hypothetical protein
VTVTGVDDGRRAVRLHDASRPGSVTSRSRT